MGEEMNGKPFSISWLFWPGLILIFIALISILNWSPPEDSKKNINSRVLQEDPQKNTKTRVLREYTPPPAPPKKPIYRPLPRDELKVESNYQPLPKEKPEKHQSKYQPLKEQEK